MNDKKIENEIFDVRFVLAYHMLYVLWDMSNED